MTTVRRIAQAGKTTLLRMLSLLKMGGTPTGTVTLNGKSFTLANYTAHAATVEQADTLWTFLSCREVMIT
jgi:ABC-type multidrug transport system ATPase subunit